MKRRTFLRHLLTAGADAALGALPRQIAGPAATIYDDRWPPLRWSDGIQRIMPSGAARTIVLPVGGDYPMVIGHPAHENLVFIPNGWRIVHERSTPEMMYFEATL